MGLERRDEELMDSCGRGQGPVTRSGKYDNYFIIILNTTGVSLEKLTVP